jgi:hypothetical protein
VGRRKAQQAPGTGNFDGDGPQGVWEEPLGRYVSHRVYGRCAEGYTCVAVRIGILLHGINRYKALHCLVYKQAQH